MDDYYYRWVSKRFAYTLFGLFILLFWINWLLQKANINIPVVHTYMDDFICLPLVLFGLLIIYRKWIIKSESYTFPISYLLIAWFVISISFEVLLPLKDPTTYTADYWDTVLYAMGAILFWYMQKPWLSSVIVNGR